MCCRLSGDYNPLHIDPEVSKRVGYETPILHGLCSMGISVRQVLAVYGADQADAVKSIKVLRTWTPSAIKHTRSRNDMCCKITPHAA